MRNNPVGRWGQWGRLSAAGVACLVLLPRGGAAQVGHDPARSPYRPLRFSQYIGVTTGLFNGNGGSLGVAPHHGPSVALRFDFLSNTTVSLGFAATYFRFERKIVDPREPIETAVTGPVKQTGGMAELILQFNLTGGKSWRGVAPYVSASGGFLLASSTPEDQSGFEFHKRLVLTPSLGTRIFLAERLFLRLELRTAFWSVSYPDSYRTPPSADPTKPPVLLAPAKEWLANGWYTIGVSYAFSRPF